MRNKINKINIIPIARIIIVSVLLLESAISGDGIGMAYCMGLLIIELASLRMKNTVLLIAVILAICVGVFLLSFPISSLVLAICELILRIRAKRAKGDENCLEVLRKKRTPIVACYTILIVLSVFFSFTYLPIEYVEDASERYYISNSMDIVFFGTSVITALLSVVFVVIRNFRERTRLVLSLLLLVSSALVRFSTIGTWQTDGVYLLVCYDSPPLCLLLLYLSSIKSVKE
jgi:predicted MFS family arabinose efflux permease